MEDFTVFNINYKYAFFNCCFSVCVCVCVLVWCVCIDVYLFLSFLSYMINKHFSFYQTNQFNSLNGFKHNIIMNIHSLSWVRYQTIHNHGYKNT